MKGTVQIEVRVDDDSEVLCAVDCPHLEAALVWSPRQTEEYTEYRCRIFGRIGDKRARLTACVEGFKVNDGAS